jgi:hypothetical protein
VLEHSLALAHHRVKRFEVQGELDLDCAKISSSGLLQVVLMNFVLLLQ